MSKRKLSKSIIDDAVDRVIQMRVNRAIGTKIFFRDAWRSDKAYRKTMSEGTLERVLKKVLKKAA